MQINAEQVMQSRKKRHWSQDELATAAGLNLRTVQRIEATGSASLQTLKAIASALESDLDAFKVIAEKVMQRYEYKSLTLPFKTGFLNQVPPDITTALNKEGREGWRLSQVLAPIGSGGSTVSMIAILERPADQAS
jgi:transcriptional regulator with XRE-family HTH domain